MKSKSTLIAVIASVISIFVGLLIFYQYFTEKSPNDFFSLIQKIEKLIENNSFKNLSDTSQRDAINRLQGLTETLANSAARQGVKELPIVYSRSEGIIIHQSEHAEFQTPSGDVSIIGVNKVSDSQSILMVDGKQAIAYVGSVFPSLIDSNCKYLIGKMNGRDKLIQIRLTCSSNNKKN